MKNYQDRQKRYHDKRKKSMLVEVSNIEKFQPNSLVLIKSLNILVLLHTKLLYL